jgi:hypothetical protein
LFVSHFPCFFSFLAIFQVLECSFLIIYIFQCILSYSHLCLLSHTFQICCHTPGHILFVSHFTCFFQYIVTFHVLQCLCLLFQTFQFSRNIPGPRVCISHFLPFSIFLAISQVRQCLCLLFHTFQFCCQTLGPTVCFSHFPRF